jgi:hypothetical protein
VSAKGTIRLWRDLRDWLACKIYFGSNCDNCVTKEPIEEIFAKFEKINSIIFLFLPLFEIWILSVSISLSASDNASFEIELSALSFSTIAVNKAAIFGANCIC